MSFVIAPQFALAQQNHLADRLAGFASRLLNAEKRIDARRPARQAGEAGGDLLYGIRAEARMQSAIRKYQEIVNAGGWASIPYSRVLRMGDRDPIVVLIRQRLITTGDLIEAQAQRSDEFDKTLHEAVVRFQSRHGLPNAGLVGRLTLSAMNVQADVRLGQLKRNLERSQGLKQLADAKRAIVVNIPAYELQAVDDDQVTLTSRVVVGRVDRKTPTISAKVVGVDLLPTWRVPPGITKRDMIPKLQSDPAYFARENFRVIRTSDNQIIDPASVDWSQPSVPAVRFEQAPGANNALGLVRVNMPNKHLVYLHDTPLRKLFERPARPFSSGCVRVERVADLAIWLLADQSKWNAGSISNAVGAGRPVSIALQEPIPVHFIYLTSWVEPDGDVNFREDIYKLDSASPLAAKYVDRSLPTQPITP